MSNLSNLVLSVISNHIINWFNLAKYVTSLQLEQRIFRSVFDAISTYQGFQQQATSKKGTKGPILPKKSDFRDQFSNKNRDQFKKKGPIFLIFLRYWEEIRKNIQLCFSSTKSFLLQIQAKKKVLKNLKI